MKSASLHYSVNFKGTLFLPISSSTTGVYLSVTLSISQTNPQMQILSIKTTLEQILLNLSGCDCAQTHLWVWEYLAPNGRSRCGSALFSSTPGELLSHSLLRMVCDPHSLPSLGHFWGQLCGTGCIHNRVHAHNLAGWKTELWCPRTCFGYWVRCPYRLTKLFRCPGSQW